MVREIYLFPDSLDDWLINPVKSMQNIYIIWKAVVVAFPLVGNWLIWRVGRGTKMKVGLDPWIGCGEDYRLPAHIIIHLK